MKKTITTIILSLFFMLSASQVNGQITFDLIVIFKKNTKAKDIEKMKQVLRAVQIDSTYPSRALLWRCQVMPGESLELPNIAGGMSVFSINSSSEAAGVISSTGQSEGVSNNNFWAIPQYNNSESIVSSIPPLYGNEHPEDSDNSIITCKPGNRSVKIAIMDSGIDCDLVNNAINIPHDVIKPYIAFRNETIDGFDNDLNGYRDDQIGYDFVNNTGVPKDSSGHGTFVTGVISRILKHNNADNVKISVLKVLDQNNRGYEFDFIRALDYAIRQK
jgi:Subtilase family